MFLIRNLIIFPSLLLAAIFARLVSQLVAAASPGPGSRLWEHQRMEEPQRIQSRPRSRDQTRPCDPQWSSEERGTRARKQK